MPNTETAPKHEVAPSPTGTVAASQDDRPRRPKTKTKPAGDPVASPSSTLKSQADTKSEIVLKKLRHAKGATIDQLMQATGWQSHLIRGFLSGTVKKKLGQTVVSEIGKDGVRRYRIEGAKKAASVS